MHWLEVKIYLQWEKRNHQRDNQRPEDDNKMEACEIRPQIEVCYLEVD